MFLKDKLKIYIRYHQKIGKLAKLRKFELRRAAPMLRSQYQLTRRGLAPARRLPACRLGTSEVLRQVFDIRTQKITKAATYYRSNTQIHCHTTNHLKELNKRKQNKANRK